MVRYSDQWFVDIGSGREVECVICLDKVCEGEKLRSLPICPHGFHVHCIDSWLQVRPTCPLCRINVAPQTNFIFSSLLSLAERLGKWVETPLYLELKSAVCESFGYI
ncbi:E3 ubiquitin-protein ligase ATL6-like [Hibiscus syriacus]|uniref:E3 ubiquitin-protein ligase ATL6-like n=1 Tax=Hibiscus syriacus TaxID=106335 RepID=UPI001920BCC2|nr:E3 ubiquitin-protein ligase ATL6-like [Hibiscus syriacus]